MGRTKPKTIIAGLTAVVAVAVILGAGAMRDGGHRHGQSQSVLLASLRGPGNWGQAGVRTDRDGDSVRRVWTRARDDFGENVFGYDSASAAERDFRASAPEKVTPDVYADARPYDIGVHSSAMDDVQYMCGEWKQGKCDTWWAWLRFSKVNVQLTYRRDIGDPQALTDSQLAVIITHAIEDLATLTRSTSS
ncbi:hypothetical protein AB0M29_34785 [Streptomyces sp. NPDC051976]|uniref:hypothetical protein n=1 Tax=Streptomyces sp. NPDC051976 TaxID=3154947 RepID=UPI00342FC538